MTVSGLVLRVVTGPARGATFEIESPTTLGREGELRVPDPTVSRVHMRIRPSGDVVEVEDAGSAAGLLVDGLAVRGPAAVTPGQRITMGDTTLVVLRLVRFHDAASGPALRISGDGTSRVVPIVDGTTIGRDETNDVKIDHPSVSRTHARLRFDDEGVRIDDLSSANGTTVDGRPVPGHSHVRDGSVIRLGAAPAALRVSTGRATASALTVRARFEDQRRHTTVTVEVDPGATVAEVTRELAQAVEAPGGRLYLLYRTDGFLLHPDDRWSSTGTRRGDELVIGEGDASAFTPAPGRYWPTPPGDGLNQLPRTVHAPPIHKVDRIDPPESTSLRGRGLLWQIVGGLGAIGVGLALAVVRPEYAVFGLITGAIGVVTVAASILGEQSRRRHRVRTFREKLVRLDQELASVRARQRDALVALAPDTVELLAWVRGSSPRLWERRPTDQDALQLGIGWAAVPARIDVDHQGTSDSPLMSELDAVIERHRSLLDTPVLGNPITAGSIGIAGEIDSVDSTLRALVMQAACQLPPTQLKIWVAATDPRWEWARWLPHVPAGGASSNAAAAREVLATVRTELAQQGSVPDVLHVVVAPTSLDDPALPALVSQLAGRGLVLAGAPGRRGLPDGLALAVQLSPDGTASISGTVTYPPSGAIRVMAATEADATELAVGLGRLDQRDAVDGPTGLVELLGLGSTTSVDVAVAWAGGTRDRLGVAVGADDRGAPVTLSFRRDGPHGMIAGTTGSGKSELLQTLLVGLALTHPPEVLSFFLIDFKGGATFAPLAGLPHVVGSVTDLENDPSLARRAFTALDAEIERRKRLLDEARVPNIIEYERLEGREPLPSLLVVIDEFALLVQRQPEVKDRLDTVATQGRSLGIHLLLATQSPSGVITHAIRTNTNLWICLRVVTESESIELLGTKDAARIPDGSPGRAIVRLGAGSDLRPFQAARIARPIAEGGPSVRVRRPDGGPGPTSPTIAQGRVTTELEVVVGRIVEHDANRDAPSIPRLWLPPLPRILTANDVARPTLDEGRLQALLGLADHPQRQTQEPLVFDLSAVGNALVGGLLGSGKTTALLQLGTDLALHRNAGDVHIYGIDAGTGSLAPLLAAPHCGDVVGATDVERLARLLDRLAGEVERRRERLATSGIGDFLRWRAAGGDAPWTVVLIDDFPTFREVADQVESGRLLERFASLLQNGPSVGIHLVIAVNQAVDLRLRETSLVPARLILRVADAADYALVDLRFRADEVPELAPGRGFASGGAEVQVCIPDTSGLSDRFDPADINDGHLPRRVARLPLSLRRTDPPIAEGTAIGLGGADVDPIEIRLDRGSPLLLVAGPIQSGRSATLRSVVATIDASGTRGRTLIIALRPSALRDLSDDGRVRVATTDEQVIEALDTFMSDPGPADLLVIDDAEALTAVFGAGDRLETILREASVRGTKVVAAFRVNDLPGIFDAWARYLVSLRRAILLQPTPDDAFLFGARLPVIPPPLVPGRGVFVEGQAIRVIQIAEPDGA